MLAVRIRAIDDKGLSPSRFAALPAATGSNDFHWMWVSIAIGQSNWPVELDLEELFFHLRAKGNEIGH
jgi:hypothetical protein